MKYKGVEVIDHTAECIEAKNHAVLRALEAIGIQAESHAKNNLTKSGHIDTGLLRNSIAHAVSGSVPTTGGRSSYSADRAESKYNFSPTIYDDKGKPVKRTGEYTISVPDDYDDVKAVYVGSNVHYAPYIEYGTDRLAPTHYIKNAVADHTDEYRKITEMYLKGG